MQSSTVHASPLGLLLLLIASSCPAQDRPAQEILADIDEAVAAFRFDQSRG